MLSQSSDPFLENAMRFLTASVSAAAAAAVLAIGLLGCHGAQRHNPAEMRKFIGWKVNDTLDDLKATDAQRQAVNAAKEQILDRFQAATADHKRVVGELLVEWEKDAPDMAKVQSLLDAQLEQRRALMKATLDDVLSVHDALTPAQRAAVSAKLREHLTE
jgi:periplasmic protein CpxP/Spy